MYMLNVIMNHPAKLYKEFYQKYQLLLIYLRLTVIDSILFSLLCNNAIQVVFFLSMVLIIFEICFCFIFYLYNYICTIDFLKKILYMTFFLFIFVKLEIWQPTFFSAQMVVVQSHSHVQLFATPCQASLSFTTSWSLFKIMFIELVMPSNHLVLCCSSSPAFNISLHQGLF